MQSAISLLALAFSGAVGAQCAPRIPSAGNPGCIPPDQQNSPYYKGQPSGADDSAQAPIVYVRTGWAALAVDRVQGSSGSAVKFKSGPAAKRTAIAECEKNGGTKCKVAIFFSDQCAAVAQPLSGGDLSTATAETVAAAKDKAIRKCGDMNTCTVLISDCSSPVLDD